VTDHRDRDMPMRLVLICIVLFVIPIYFLYHAIVGTVGVALALTGSWCSRRSCSRRRVIWRHRRLVEQPISDHDGDDLADFAVAARLMGATRPRAGAAILVGASSAAASIAATTCKC